MHRIFRFLSPLILLAAFTVTGCDLFGSDDTARVTLNSVADTSPVAKAAAAKSASGHVVIDSVKVLFKSIRFHTDDDVVEGEGEEPVEGEEEGGEESATFHSAPVIVELLLDGSPNEIEVAEIPVGTYDKISFHLHKPRGNQEAEEFPDFAGETPNERWSVVVWGLFEGELFEFKSAVNVVQVVDFDEPFDVEDGASHSATLQVDLSTWFVSLGGVDLAPTDTSEQNRAMIDQSIRNSFHLFQDEDEDGEADSE
jgi:hypothetical protein